MRIRKHAKSSCLSFFEAPISPCLAPKSQEHVCCELNQSPWDVPDLDFDFSPPKQSKVITREDFVSGNGSRGESLGTFESGVSSLKEEERNITSSSSTSSLSIGLLVAEKGKKKKGIVGKKESFRCCNKTDGKGWKCRKEAKEGHLLCEHHLVQLKSYKHKYAGRKSNRVEVPVTKTRLPNHRVKKRISSSNSSSSPGNYYYYTGFGPLWGKRSGDPKRREIEAEADANTVQIRTGNTQTTLSSSSHDGSDDDDNNDEVVMKKKARKPIKTRSLKSLIL